MNGQWHEEFLGSQTARVKDERSFPQASAQSKYMTDDAQLQLHDGFTGASFGSSASTHSQAYPVNKQRTYDEEAFTKAFDKAEQDVASSSDIQSPQAPSKSAVSSEKAVDATPEPVSYRIGSDWLFEEDNSKIQGDDENDDTDELSRTAGQLLESVKGDTSKKFQQSNFLSLMRQLRDREVRVDGDKIVNVC